MIRVPCPHCGAKLTVPAARAGKAGRCPRCKSRLTVPPAPESEPELELVRDDTPDDTRSPSKLLDQVAVRPPRVPASKNDDDSAENRLAQRMLDSLSPNPAREHTGERRLPWLLDILLYPLSVSGVITMAVLVFFPLFMHLLPLGLFIGGRYIFWGPTILLGLYTGWYLAECVYDSAKGGTRAPEIVDASTGLGDLWSRVSYLLAVYLLFMGPALIYRMYPGRMDAIFWGLVAWAILFFPMGLLAMVIHDSTSVLNPLFLLGSIFRVFFPYGGLLLGIAALAVLFVYASHMLGQGLAQQWLGLFNALTGAYAALVMAHLLGRFYWRYRDRLDWGI